MRTFYSILYWLKDNGDFREIDRLDSLEQALAKARELNASGKGYHDFFIYGYHARLETHYFEEDGVRYRYKRRERVEDDFEPVWDINGNKI